MLATGGAVNLTMVTEFFSEATSEMIENAAKCATMMQVQTEPEESLYVPWGWLVIERAELRKEVFGFRWALITDEASETFSELIRYVLPDGPGVRPTSSLQLLAKIAVALQQVGTNGPLASLGGKRQESICAVANALMPVKNEQPNSQAAKRRRVE